jgi:hypothetical protein
MVHQDDPRFIAAEHQVKGTRYADECDFLVRVAMTIKHKGWLLVHDRVRVKIDLPKRNPAVLRSCNQEVVDRTIIEADHCVTRVPKFQRGRVPASFDT